MKRAIIGLIILSLFVSGCISMGKKKCETSACMKTALFNNCEEAYLEGEALGIKVTSEITNQGDKCKVVETAQGITETCYFDMPVESNLFPECTIS